MGDFNRTPAQQKPPTDDFCAPLGAGSSQFWGGKAWERGPVAFLLGLKPRAVSQNPRVPQTPAWM